MAIDDRLLTVLSALNVGPSTALGLSRATGVSRTAVYRILTALSDSGYIRRIQGTAVYEVTAKVRQLSIGYREHDWIATGGAKAIAKLQAQVRWPTSLSVADQGEMVIRETTRFRSPFVFDIGAVGLRLPMFGSSMGMAYFAFADSQTRNILVKINEAKGRPALMTDHQIQTIRNRGYAMRIGGIQPKTASLAVPILSREGAVGAICITYARVAVSQTQAAASFVALLRETAADIADAYSKSGTR